MANTNSVRGFLPLKYFNGAPWQGAVRPYVIDAGNGTATFVGDLVSAAGNQTKVSIVGSSYRDQYLPRVLQATANDTIIVGSVVAFEPLTTSLQLLYRLASTERVAFVVDDPMVIYQAQTNGASGITAANVMQNYHIVVGSGSTVTGYSGMQIADSTAATTATYEIRMLRLAVSADNTLGQYNKVECMLNNCYFKAGTAGV